MAARLRARLDALLARKLLLRHADHSGLRPTGPTLRLLRLHGPASGGQKQRRDVWQLARAAAATDARCARRTGAQGDGALASLPASLRGRGGEVRSLGFLAVDNLYGGRCARPHATVLH